LVAAIYNESGRLITARAGGVGSVDESFSAALIAGRPFICLDNFRGKLDSQHLESFLTCPGEFQARVPHRGEVSLDPKRFIPQLTSNGLATTRDFALRSCICRIRKRPPGFKFRDALAEIQQRQPYYLGCVFSVIAKWVNYGKPQTDEMRHDFRPWCQRLDWIVRNIFGCAPLMDDHEMAQERVCNPGLTWLRQIAVALEHEDKLGEAWLATDLVETSNLHGVDIPGLREPNEDHAKRQVGILMARIFKGSNEIIVEDHRVTRGEHEYRKPSGDWDKTPSYTFSRATTTQDV
jgi:hypothetical protein